MPKSNERATPDLDAIAKRAYELYLQRGSVSGHELDDWLDAEAELSSAAAQPDEAPVQPVVRRRAARSEAHRRRIAACRQPELARVALAFAGGKPCNPPRALQLYGAWVDTKRS